MANRLLEDGSLFLLEDGSIRLLEGDPGPPPPPPGPTVSTTSPTHGDPAGGNSVVIAGSGFTGATAVHFGSVAASFVVDSDIQITATAPAQMPGTVHVTVTVP